MKYTQKANFEMGQFLLRSYLEKYCISQNMLAFHIKVIANRINEIVHGRSSITADTDIRLCKFFGLEDGYFLQKLLFLQIKYAKLEMNEKLKDIPQRPKK